MEETLGSTFAANAAPPRAEDEADLQGFLSRLQAHDPAEWKELVNIPEMQVLRSYKSQFPFKFRIRCLLQNTAVFCFKILTDENNWVLEHVNFGNLPRLIKSAKRLEDIDSYTKVIHCYIQGHWPVTDRDIVFQMHERFLGDGRIVAVGRTIEHPAAPAIPNVLRVTGEVSGAVFSPVEDGSDRCWVEMMFEGDPQGWIPDRLVSLGAKLAPQALWLVNKLLKGPRARAKFRAQPAIPGQAGAPSQGALLPLSSSSPPVSPPTTITAGVVPARATATAPAGHREVTTRPGAALQRARHSGWFAMVLEVRRALQWASPFMVFIIYFCVMYTFARRRLRPVSQ